MEFGNVKYETIDESISIRKIFDKYLIHLKWFILSVVICAIIGLIKFNLEVPVYKITSKILIKNQEQGKSISDLSGIEELELFGSSDNNLENEIQILTSRKLMNKVVQELNLNTKYYLVDSPYDKEFYPNPPVLLNFYLDSLNGNHVASEFKIIVLSKFEFEFFNHDDESIGKKKFDENFVTEIGNKNVVVKKEISISLNSELSPNIIGKMLKIRISPVSKTIDAYLLKLEVEPVDSRLSNVLIISINESSIEKGKTLINNLIEQYNADGINDNNLNGETSTKFLTERIQLIGSELDAIEETAAQFKKNKGFINVESNTGSYIESSSLNSREIVSANTQLELVNYMLDQLNSKNDSNLLPSNIGLSDPGIINSISKYNSLVLQRNRILKSSSIKNPIILGIDSQLENIKVNLKNSLQNLASSSQIQINALQRKSGRINSKIAAVPLFEKEYKDIIRQQETKNSLYLFLLQKREESILSNAVNIEKAKIIDQAFSSNVPVSPKKYLTLLVSVILGLLIPFVVIYVKNLLDVKVHDQDDLVKLEIPFLGDVPKALSSKNMLINDKDDSNVAEAYRYIRSNINFMLDKKDTGRTILITSTKSNEGKTFTAINLAISFALSGKKTLLLAMDLRAPKINSYLDLEESLGVTDFIKNQALNIQEIIEKNSSVNNLDIINSGSIPPNPVELLMDKRVNELFNYLKDKYDYIVVDSAPVGMVTDAIHVAGYSDLSIYVVKANFLDKRLLHIPNKLHLEKKLPNMAMLINSSNPDHSSYGYGYGYGKTKKLKWFQKMFKHG